jgi:hypothetical protein
MDLVGGVAPEVRPGDATGDVEADGSRTKTRQGSCESHVIEVGCRASEVDELEVSHGTTAEMFQKPPPG